MKKVLLLVAAALVLAPAAPAKELLGMQLCGASGCATDKDKSLAGLMRSGPLGGDGQAIAPAAPGKWYRVYALAGDHGKVYGKMPLYWVPSGDSLVLPGDNAQTPTWQRPNANWRAVLTRLAAKVEPFAAPTLTAVRLNGDAASDPQSYLSLFTVGEKATTYPKDVDSIQIVLESKRRTPWTDGNYLALYPKSNLLVRDGQLVSIPVTVSDAVVDGVSLDRRDAFPWISLLVGLAVIVLVLGGAWFLPRPAARAQPVPQP